MFVPAAPGSLAARSPTPANPSQAAPTVLSDAGAMPAAVLLSFAGAISFAARGRVARRAEPVSTAAAAAAVAAKSAAAAGAAKTAGAVAGSAGVGSMAQSADDNDTYDPALDRKFSKLEVGTEDYKKSMEQKRKRNEMAWEAATGRNPDGVGGDPQAARRRGYRANDYDPFMATEGKWSPEASAAGKYGWDPAFAIGAMEPLGYFDPVGFTTNEPTFRKLRTAEIKHGRVAMMAALGAVVQHYVRFPGFQGVPSGLAAVNTSPGKEGAVALFLLCGALELGLWTEDEEKEPGNFGDPLGLNQYTDDMRAREINNGRFAMFAVIGIISAELLTGKDAVQQLGF